MQAAVSPAAAAPLQNEEAGRMARARHELLDVDGLLGGSLVDARAHLDLEHVARYGRLPTRPPPAIVFEPEASGVDVGRPAVVRNGTQ
jgi:hypothetical protein